MRTRLFAFARRITRRPGRAGGPSLAELAHDAGHALVAADDAVRTSESELGFAVARFGEQAAKPFSAALAAARAELEAAFRIRQHLDDDGHASEARKRALLTEIIARCAEASRLLDDQAEAFDLLQDVAARAPRVLAEVDAHAAQQTTRLGQSRQIIDKLAAKYTPRAVAAVVTNPDQAVERLEFAAGSLADARRSLAADQASRAAVFLQAAESAADQASELLDSVEHLEAELTQAVSALPATLREIDADIVEAAELATAPDAARRYSAGRAGPDQVGPATAAETAVTAVRGQLGGGPFDPLAALRTLAQADAVLDRALVGLRDERDRQLRARAVLDQAMLLARSAATTAEDFVRTRRGGVGAAARTRLAEAHRHYRLAIDAEQPDPESALSQAQQSDALAQQARALAEEDVAQFQRSNADSVTGPDGSGDGARGAILGGILIDSLSGGVGPSSFGGISERGRHSVSGRC